MDLIGSIKAEIEAFHDRTGRHPILIVMHEQTVIALAMHAESDLKMHPEGGFILMGVRLIRTRDINENQMIIS